MNNIERNHIFQLFSLLFNILFKNIIFFVLGFNYLFKKFDVYESLIIILICLVSILVISFISWYNCFFYLKESSIVLKKGVFSITKREIPFEKVNTVDISQNIIQKIFNLSQIKIDTGTVKTSKSELSLLLKSYRAKELKNLLLNNEINSDELEKNNNIFKLNSKDLLIYSLTSNTILNGIGIIFILYNFVDDYINNILDIDLFSKLNITNFSFIKIIFGLLFILSISVILAIIKSFIKYYNFKVFVEKNKLNISYGLFNKKNYSFQINKIKGLHIKQNLTMQLFNLRTIEIESIGYGDEDDEKAILFPIINLNSQKEIINNLMPFFNFRGNIYKSEKPALFRFIFKKLVFVSLIISVSIYFSQYGYFSILLIPISLILGYMQYKNSAVGISNDLVFMSRNGFNKVQSIVKLNAAQSFEISYSYFQRLKGLCNLNTNIFSNNFGNNIKVSNLNYNLVNKIINKTNLN